MEEKKTANASLVTSTLEDLAEVPPVFASNINALEKVLILKSKSDLATTRLSVLRRELNPSMDTMVPLTAPIHLLSVIPLESNIAQETAWEEEPVSITSAFAIKVSLVLIAVYGSK